MGKDEFDKLYSYIQDFRKEVNDKFNKAEENSRELKGAVVELAGLIKNYHEEMLALAHKVDRLERWIHQIAEKTGVKLAYNDK